MNEVRVPAEVGAAWVELAGGFSTERGPTGLLHQTVRVANAAGERFVLQRVSAVFAPEIHDNIAAVTAHLAARGLHTFRLVPTRTGAWSLDLGPAGRWRLLTRLDGVSFDRIASLEQARSAAALVGRFHAALADFDAPLAPMGLPFRDTPLYRSRLETALAAHRDHAQRAAVSDLRERIDRGFAVLGPPLATRERVIHADLKISNVLFAGRAEPDRDRAVALIDFDTLMRAPLYCEWGDAWRSWCNRRGEDEGEATFDLDVFAATVEGFAEGFARGVDRHERASLIDATERMALELATRYATDALEGDYFAWDAERFPDATAHNLVRAEGQLALFAAARATRDERRSILEGALPV